MRIGVLDVGSNSVHLKTADVTPGGPPCTATSLKRRTRLAEAIEADGSIGERAVDRLVAAVAETVAEARRQKVDELVAFATSAVRGAVNRQWITTRIRVEAGLELGFLDGPDEARLTFLAVRGWYGWSAGPLLLMDIGGGSFEIAYGEGHEPVVALSLPLGAGRLTQEHLPGDPPSSEDVDRLRTRVREMLRERTGELRSRPAPVRVAATSKTFKQLARLTGAPKGKAGPYVRRTLRREDLSGKIPKLAGRTTRRRARMRGISSDRAAQIVAGAIVAEAAMEVLDLEEVDICPWAVREGVISHRMATMPVLATDDLHDLLELHPDVTETPEPDQTPDGPTAAEAEELTARHL
jgi:exopolyphosphatase / guanosine-5'-triphosphate,3'-diphosphate pyrophosphatase